MSQRHILLAVLKRTGTFRQQHNRRMGLTLGEHLTNTYDDLIRMGADEDVAIAGGLHSIYGTNSFRQASLDADKRPRNGQSIGKMVLTVLWVSVILWFVLQVPV